MRKELEDKLFNKYPEIFKQKDLPARETCMCWGITCGDGWYDIIDNLCKLIKLLSCIKSDIPIQSYKFLYKSLYKFI